MKLIEIVKILKIKLVGSKVNQQRINDIEANTIELKEFNIKSITNIPLAIYYSIINFFIFLDY